MGIQEQKLLGASGRSGERGAGKLKAIIVTLILAFLVLVAVRTVPPYTAEFQLSDKMDETARYATVKSYSEDQIRDTVYQTKQDLDIPATKDDIKVTATRQVVKITVDYTLPINLIVFHTQMHLTPHAENHSIV